MLKGTDAALALIPCGRGNDLARVLGVPTDPFAAAELAVEGPERLIDVANVDGKSFLGIASFGFDSDANRIANEAKIDPGQRRLPVRRPARPGRLEAGARSR